MSPDPETTQPSSRRSYLPVPLDVFCPDQPLPFSLYSSADDSTLALACPPGEALSAGALKVWRDAAVRVLYIDTAEHRLYQQFAEAAMADIIARDDLPSRRKVELCYATTRELVREACDSSNLNLEELAGQRREKWADSLATLVCQDETVLDGMLSMLLHDYYTYTHMVNVSTMVTALAYRMGQRDHDKLSMIASGGLLHDIGKMRIDPDTLNKIGPLSEQERDELQQHPVLGLEFLHGRENINPQQLRMVHQHHEKLDGSGYPSGVVGGEISTEAQMTAVVDIYDAMTCKRPYRDAIAHQQAISVLTEQAGTKLNAEMASLWKETIERAVAGADSD